MALTAVLTKQDVTLVDGIYNIILKCTISENSIVIWEGTGAGRYNPNIPNLNEPKDAILAELKKKWDKWVDEQGVFNSPGLDSEVSSLETIITNYINS